MDMRAVAVAVVLTTGLWAGNAAAQDAKVQQGQQVYTDQHCSICHSIGGKGNAKGPLDTVGAKLSADDLRQWIVDAKGMTEKTKADRKPFMKAYALPKGDVDALVAYLQTLKGK
jgi:mono/diheme cytochrome c family protein